MTLSSFLRNPFGRNCVPVVGTSAKLDISDAAPDVRKLIREHRYFQVLAPSDGVTYDEQSIACAWEAVEHQMAFIPQGDIELRDEAAFSADHEIVIDPSATSAISVEACYIDRMCVTNAQFKRFVDEGCYAMADLWPESILPMVLHSSIKQACLARAIGVTANHLRPLGSSRRWHQLVRS